MVTARRQRILRRLRFYWLVDMVEPFILTFTGRRINPLALRREDVRIEDIAHHLALANRFAGATIQPISVAQHSVYVSRLCCGTGFELQALLHDAAEYVLGDCTKWLKESDGMEIYREAEDRAQREIYAAFGIGPESYDELTLKASAVERADRVMVMHEGAQGFGANWSNEHLDPEAYGSITAPEQALIGSWSCWPWFIAERRFLKRARACRNGRTG